jgi:hypothetical protein
MTYPLGWSVITHTQVRRERWPGGPKTKAVPLVYPGQEVLPDQPVLRLERPEGTDPAQEAVQMPSRLSLPGISSTAKMELKDVHNGASSAKGGPEVVPAGMHGRVVDITGRGGVIIEGQADLIQGTIGAGNQVAGVLTMWQASGQGIASIPPGAILVVPGPLNFALLRQALSSGVAGVVASSISARDLEGFLRVDLVQLIDSSDVEEMQDHLPQLTLLLTEGLGTAAMPARIMNLLSQYQGEIVLLSGVTSVRQGIFPELVISLPASEKQSNHRETIPDPTPTIGAQVRVCGGEHEGAIGVIDYLFTYQQRFTSGIRARAVRLHLEDGSILVVPITLVERIG